jgi:uncharacterized protein YbjT (DUF2867 family)
VTGATGLIGGRLAQARADAGWIVRCLVRERSRARDLEQRGFELHEGDVFRPATLERAGRDAEVAYYLTAAPDLPKTAGHEIQIGGPSLLAYGEMLDRMAEALGRRPRPKLPVPLLTPRLLSLSGSAW